MGNKQMNSNRLPFTVAQSFGQIFREPRVVPHDLVVNDREICLICGGLFIVVAAICGAFLGFYL